MKIKILIAATTLLLFNGPVIAELDPLENYDNFNAKKYNGCKWCINSDNWRGGERGSYNAEVERRISGKRARLSHRSWGGTSSDDGTETGRNRMIFRDSEFFSGVCFTPRALKYEINTCEGNGSSGSAQIRYVGNFFDADDDGGDDIPDMDDETGLVYAWFGLRRWSDGPSKKGRFNVSGNASQCANADCSADAWSTYDGADIDPDLFFGTIKGNKNKKELCVGYDRMTHELVFSYDGDERRVNQLEHGLPDFAVEVGAELTWHVLEARTDVHNCTAGQLTGYVDGDYDNVKIREIP